VLVEPMTRASGRTEPSYIAPPFLARDPAHDPLRTTPCAPKP